MPNIQQTPQMASHLQEAAAFLEDVAGELPIAVARISPEGGGPRGETFRLPAQRAGLEAWLQEHDGRENLYYSLNAPKSEGARIGRAGKLAEADVAFILWRGAQ